MHWEEHLKLAKKENKLPLAWSKEKIPWQEKETEWLMLKKEHSRHSKSWTKLLWTKENLSRKNYIKDTEADRVINRRKMIMKIKRYRMLMSIQRVWTYIRNLIIELEESMSLSFNWNHFNTMKYPKLLRAKSITMKKLFARKVSTACNKWNKQWWSTIWAMKKKSNYKTRRGWALSSQTQTNTKVYPKQQLK